MDYDNLSHQFLIAMPDLSDPAFFHTVTYVCSHTEEGAMGITINRPLPELHLSDVLYHMGIKPSAEDAMGVPVYLGGPVEPERGFVLHRPAGAWEGMRLGDGALGLSTSREILNAIAAGRGPEKMLIALGYAGWTAGQLEAEMAENAWLSCPADEHILFDLPATERWEAAAAKLGVDLTLLSHQAGHS